MGNGGCSVVALVVGSGVELSLRSDDSRVAVDADRVSPREQIPCKSGDSARGSRCFGRPPDDEEGHPFRTVHRFLQKIIARRCRLVAEGATGDLRRSNPVHEDGVFLWMLQPHSSSAKCGHSRRNVSQARHAEHDPRRKRDAERSASFRVLMIRSCCAA